MMRVLPRPLQKLVDSALVQPRQPAFLLTDSEGGVIRWGGDVERYGLKGLQKGRKIEGDPGWLQGLIPLQKPLREDYLYLPWVQVGGNLVADLLLTEGEEGVWILLLEASEEEQQRRQLQQQANEYSLFKEKLGEGLTENLGLQKVTTELEKILDIPAAGLVKRVAVLAVVVRQEGNYRTEIAHGKQLEELDLCSRSLARICRHRGGLVEEEGWGGRLTAVFGLLPAEETPVEQAVSAALEGQEEDRQSDAEVVCALSMGIATGDAVVGIVGHRRRSFRAIGEPGEKAAQLARLARAGEIAIDGSTFAVLGRYERRFAACPERSRVEEGGSRVFVWGRAEKDGDY